MTTSGTRGSGDAAEVVLGVRQGGDDPNVEECLTLGREGPRRSDQPVAGDAPSDWGRLFGSPGGHARRVQRRSLPIKLVGLAEAVEHRRPAEPVPHARLVPFL
jgi:hypothetical protein